MHLLLIGKHMKPYIHRVESFKIIDTDTFECKMYSYDEVKDMIITKGITVTGISKLNYNQKGTPGTTLYLPKKIPNINKIPIVNEIGTPIENTTTKILFNIKDNMQYQFICSDLTVETVDKENLQTFLSENTVIGFDKNNEKPQNVYKEHMGGFKRGMSFYDWCLENEEYGQKLLSEWLYEVNDLNNVKPTEVSRGDHTIPVTWQCSDCGHIWTTNTLGRTHKTHKRGCPECSKGKIAKARKERSLKDGNNLYDWCKNNGWWGEQLLKEWDYEKNNELGFTPHNVSRASGEFVHWKCEYGHSWKTDISHRTRLKSKCPLCYGKISYPERFLYKCLQQLEPTAELGYRLPPNLGNYGLDVCLPIQKVAIEYNGFLWHRELRDTTELEKTKTDICNQYGVRLIHINDNEGTELPILKDNVISFIRKQSTYQEQLKIIVDILVKEIKLEGDIDYERAEKEAHLENKTLAYEDSFEYNYEYMLSEWDYDKNGDLLPSLVSKQSGNPVWWKCSHCGYEEHKAANIKTRNKTCKNCGLEYWKLEQQFKGNDTPKEKLIKPKKKSKTTPLQLGQFNL